MIKYILYALLLLSAFACGDSEDGSKNYYVGDKIEKEIEIDFDASQLAFNDWHAFKLDYSNELTVDFSKGNLSDETYTISAEAYQEDTLPIAVTIQSNTPGTYFFEMAYKKSSKGSEVVFTADDKIVFPELFIKERISKWWYVLFIAVIMISGILLWIYFKRKKEASFETGYIQMIRPSKDQVDLTGKREVNLGKELKIEEKECILTCESYSEFDEDEEVIVKQPSLQVGDGYQIIINNKEEFSNPAYLSHKDKVVVYNEMNAEVVEFQYNQY